MNYFFAVLLQIFLICLNAIFAGAEIAVISMNKTKIGILAAKGGKNAKKAKKLTKLTDDPARFLSTIQVAITLSGFLGSAFAADTFAEPLVAWVDGLGTGIPVSVISPVCVLLITLILAFFNIVFGELVPKRIAMNAAEKVSTSLTGLLSVVSVAFRPIVWLLSVSTNGVLKLFGISKEDEKEEVTEEDILMMAEVGEESGSIESEENQLIKNIFEFSELTIDQLCTHRKEVVILYLDETEEEWREKIHATSHSYYPLCGENADDVQGVISAKTYFRLEDKTKENVLKNAVKTPLFLYETTPANKVFERMKKTCEYFGIVLDEYGGMSGIITMHDLLEAIVGDMDEEGEQAEYSIENLGENTWEIQGLAPFDEVEEALGVNIEREEDEEYETFSGYVLSLIGALPTEKEEYFLSTKQLDVQILKIERQCIVKMKLFLKEQENEEEE